MKIQARYDLAAEMGTGYWAAPTAQARRSVIDHFVAVTGYNRKYAVTLLRGRKRKRTRRRRAVLYGVSVSVALAVLWEASGYVCALRLQAGIPALMESLERHRALRVDLQTREKLLRVSVATLKRLLKPIAARVRGVRLSTTKPGTLLKRHIPVELGGCEANVAGYLEIDLVAHCGHTGAGQFLHTLCATDLATGWTERVAIQGKSQQAVRVAMERIERQLPFVLLGIHSDNGSEFINALLIKWAIARKIKFSRGRPYKKNDNAHVEQKNWTLVRKIIGYARLETQEQGLWLNALYTDLLRPFNNGFQPVIKLIKREKCADGKTRKRYDVPATPLQRIKPCGGVLTAAYAQLQTLVANTNPLALKREIDRTLAAMPALLEVEISA